MQRLLNNRPNRRRTLVTLALCAVLLGVAVTSAGDRSMAGASIIQAPATAAG